MPILLKQLIQNYKSLMLGSTPPELIDRVVHEQTSRRQSVWFKSVLRAGHQAPDINLPVSGEPNSEWVPLSRLLQHGPVLLKFYRGRWCPFCTLELKAYQKLMPAFEQAGVRLFAITGESPEKIALTRRHDMLSFDCVHDTGLNIAREFGLAYSLGPAEIELYQRHSCLTDQCSESHKMELPLPALYLIGADRKILHAHVSTDASERAEPAQLIRLIQQNAFE